MNGIPDITETEEWVVRTTSEVRYGTETGMQFADAESRLDPADREPISCPVVLWNADGCRFVIFETGARLYRCQFSTASTGDTGAGCTNTTITPNARWRGCRLRPIRKQPSVATSTGNGADRDSESRQKTQ